MTFPRGPAGRSRGPWKGKGGEGSFHILLDRQSALDIGAFVVDFLNASVLMVFMNILK